MNTLPLGESQCHPEAVNMVKLYTFLPDNMPNISGIQFNDVWGYVDPVGNEYAIVGSIDTIYIFDVTDPINVVKVDGIYGGGSCLWRDFKTYGTKAYASSDACSEGLHVLDLSNLPNSFSIETTTTAFWSKTHNIFIDEEAGRLYSVGSDTVYEGMVILDLAANPSDPPLLKKIVLDTLPGEDPSKNYYIHDIFVRDNIAYASHGYLGYVVWDVADVENIKRLGAYFGLPSSSPSYVHSSWNTDDNNYAYVATEIGNRQIYIMNQSELFDGDNLTNAIELETTWKEPLLDCGSNPHTDNVPHNPYVHNDVMYISYYQDGVQLLDVSTPNAINRMGYYDLSNNSVYSGTRGTWGVYPFLPSGSILATDTNTGFHVLKYEIFLPLEIIHFAITPERQGWARLNWDVANAIGVDKFELQHSDDGIHFRGVDNIDYLEDVTKYSTSVELKNIGNQYFRLKIWDWNGKFSYSNVLSIFNTNKNALTIFPNPTNGFLNIQTSQSSVLDLTFSNLNGRIVYHTKSTKSTPNAIMDVSHLPRGLYYLQVINTGQTSTHKIIIE